MTHQTDAFPSLLINQIVSPFHALILVYKSILAWAQREQESIFTLVSLRQYKLEYLCQKPITCSKHLSVVSPSHKHVS